MDYDEPFKTINVALHGVLHVGNLPARFRAAELINIFGQGGRAMVK